MRYTYFRSISLLHKLIAYTKTKLILVYGVVSSIELWTNYLTFILSLHNNITIICALG